MTFYRWAMSGEQDQDRVFTINLVTLKALFFRRMLFAPGVDLSLAVAFKTFNYLREPCVCFIRRGRDDLLERQEVEDERYGADESEVE